MIGIKANTRVSNLFSLWRETWECYHRPAIATNAIILLGHIAVNVM